jgi:hypothetical protein
VCAIGFYPPNIDDKDLTIVPFDRGKAAIYGDCNATARADSPRDAAPEGISGTLPGASAWYAGKGDDPSTPLRDERYDRMPYGLSGTRKSQ